MNLFQIKYIECESVHLPLFSVTGALWIPCIGGLRTMLEHDVFTACKYITCKIISCVSRVNCEHFDTKSLLANEKTFWFQMTKSNGLWARIY